MRRHHPSAPRTCLAVPGRDEAASEEAMGDCEDPEGLSTIRSRTIRRTRFS